MTIFGTGEDAVVLTRRIPSIFQLLPNRTYSKKNPNWLTFSADLTGHDWFSVVKRSGTLSDCSEPYALYRDIYAGFTDRLEFRELGAKYVALAECFHRALGDESGTTYMPKETHVVYVKDKETPVGYKLGSYPLRNVNGRNQFDFYKSVHTSFPFPHFNSKPLATGDVLVSVDGDETVPTMSAAPPKATNKPVEKEITGSSHQKLPQDPKTIDYLVEKIAAIGLKAKAK